MKHICFFTLVLLVSTNAQSAFITYNIDRLIGETEGVSGSSTIGRVIGTLTTDGTIGHLGNQNIVDWNLRLQSTFEDSNTEASFNLLGPLSGDNSHIVFDFEKVFLSTRSNGVDKLFIDYTDINGTAHNVFQLRHWVGEGFISYEAVYQIQNSIVFQDESILIFDQSRLPLPRQAQSYVRHPTGIELFGTAAVPVPTPSNVFMFILAMGFIGWRKITASKQN